MAVQDGQAMADLRQTVVLLGASNLVLGWNSAIRSLTTEFIAPLDVYVACGLGRSYLASSRFAVRRLPGILQSGLWAALPAPTAAIAIHAPLVLLTDIGNDLVYRRDPAQILAAVEECVGRLRQWRADCRILMTGLPLKSVHSLSQLRFQIARLLLFPGAKVRLPQIQAEADELNSLIRDLAERTSVPFFEPPGEWYGLDPIHIRRSVRDQAFRQILGSWGNGDAVSDRRPWSFSNQVALPRAQECEVFGRTRTAAQPSFSSDRLQVFGF